MMTRRLLSIGAAVAGVSLGLTACGGGSSGDGAETTPAPNTTPWRTLAPVAGDGTASSVPLEGGAITYTIRPGDYANRIASRAGGGCSGTELLAFNPDVKTLIAGDTLKIPAQCLATGVTEESLNTPGDDTATDSPDASDPESDTTDVPTYNIYTVVTGDYAFGIVKKTGCSYDELKKANPGKMSNLKPKMKLKVPVSCDTREEDASDSSD